MMPRPHLTTRRARTAAVLFVLFALVLVACPAARLNNAPIAIDQNVSTVEGTPLAITLTATDPDGDALTFTIVADPEHGTLTGTPPDLTYTPDQDYSGGDAFAFTASDGSLASDVATVTIDVAHVNHPPIALDQNVATDANAPVDLTLTATDPDGDDLDYTIVDPPAHGTLTGTPPHLTYTPDTGYAGLDALTFTANDGALTSNEATITIDVGGTNDAPTDLTLDHAAVPENRPSGTQVGTLTTTDPDPTDDHTYALVTGAGDDDNADFYLTDATLYTNTTFDHEATPTKSIRVRTTDLLGATHDAAFTIAIEDVNEPPTAIELTPTSIPENQPAGTLVGTFATTDPDAGETHTYSLTTGTWDDDNHRFTIVDDTLHSQEPFDHETTPTLRVRVLSQDTGGLGIEQAITVTVTDVAEPAVTAVTIDQGDVRIEVGEEIQLSATVVAVHGADPSLAWSSDDESIATVSPSGAVTGVAIGGSTVRAASVFDPTRWDSVPVSVQAPSAFPITGPTSPGMECYDEVVSELMQQYEIPGGAVAVVKDGRLVFAHGYGWADVERAVPVQPDTLFRVASVSKPVTSVAILLLWEEGQLALDDPAFAYLSDLEPPAGATVDPRLTDITIADLLQHSGGWDRDQTFDPMFRSQYIAESMGESPPASAETIIRFMLGQPLQFDPGSQHTYSNYGYAVLGRVLERITDTPYGEWVTDHVLEPAGATGMIQGRTRFDERAPTEALYYAVPGEALDYRLVSSVFPEDGIVPEPYGGFYLEAMDAPGGWVASTIDLLRFVGAVDGRADPPDIVSPGTIQVMTARPPEENATWRDTASWYAMGWGVQPVSDEATWWHSGSLPGTRTSIVRAYDGVSWAAVFNARTVSGGSSFGSAIESALGAVRHEVTVWPDEDLFPLFP
jgi:N-acyl-D-amino-acid deacylase